MPGTNRAALPETTALQAVPGRADWARNCRQTNARHWDRDRQDARRTESGIEDKTDGSH
jgi:hypothetical protein